LHMLLIRPPDLANTPSYMLKMAGSSLNPPKNGHILTDGDQHCIQRQYREHPGYQSTLIAW
jgi:hypothetical protein